MPITIFICYARKDEALLNKLKTHLEPLRREGLIDVWHDRDITDSTFNSGAISLLAGGNGTSVDVTFSNITVSP